MTVDRSNNDVEGVSVSNWIKSQLEKRNITQTEMAEYLGVHKGSVSDWIAVRNNRRPRPEHISQLCSWWDYTPQMTAQALKLRGINNSDNLKPRRAIVRSTSNPQIPPTPKTPSVPINPLKAARVQLQENLQFIAEYLQLVGAKSCLITVKEGNVFVAEIEGGQSKLDITLKD